MENRGLPKWAKMIVTGTPVSKEQALEVIRRTDRFFEFPSGNNHEFIERVMNLLKYPDVMAMAETMPINKALAIKREWNEKWGLISTAFVRNDWVSSSYILGPHGWMHPDGCIGYCDTVGKYPSVEEIFKDWELIAKEFPFLEVESTVYIDSEKDIPAASFLVNDGKVEVVDPQLRNIHMERGRDMASVTNYSFHALDADTQASIVGKIFGDRIENAIPFDVIEQWANAFTCSN